MVNPVRIAVTTDNIVVVSQVSTAPLDIFPAVHNEGIVGMSVGVGVGAFLATQGINYLIDKLKKSLDVKGLPNEIKDVEVKQEISDGETDNVKGKLIKERETS